MTTIQQQPQYPPQQVSLTLDASTADSIFRSNKKISDYVHHIANEPSVGMYHVQEHIRKAVPKNVVLKKDSKALSNHIQEVSYNVEDSIRTVQSINEITTFNHIHELLLGSIDRASKLVNNKSLAFINSQTKESSASKTFNSYPTKFSTSNSSIGSVGSSIDNMNSNQSSINYNQLNRSQNDSLSYNNYNQQQPISNQSNILHQSTSSSTSNSPNNNNNNNNVNNNNNSSSIIYDTPTTSSSSTIITTNNNNSSFNSSFDNNSLQDITFNDIPINSDLTSTTTTTTTSSNNSSFKKKSTNKSKKPNQKQSTKKDDDDLFLKPKQF